MTTQEFIDKWTLLFADAPEKNITAEKMRDFTTDATLFGNELLTTLKTINGNSLLGGGDLSISNITLPIAISDVNTLQSMLDSKQDDLISGTNIKTVKGQSLLGSGNIDITKSDVGLGNVDNISDIDKPISTLVQSALDEKQDDLVSGANIKTIEGQSILGSGNIDITKSDVGLGNVDNTSDIDKPISMFVQTALDGKQNELVSGTNIKTINGNTLLGSGDVVTAQNLQETTDNGNVTTSGLIIGNTLEFLGGGFGKIEDDSGALAISHPFEITNFVSDGVNIKNVRVSQSAPGNFTIIFPDASGTVALTNNLTDFIKLTGTDVGSPINGDIEFQGERYLIGINPISGLAAVIINSDDNTISLQASDGTIESGLTIFNDRLVFGSSTLLSRGITGNVDYTPNITDLDYTQKKYVDDTLVTGLDLKADKTITVNGQDLASNVILTTNNISENTNLYFTTARVLATLISGFAANPGVITSSDTILQVFNKLVGNLALKLAANVPITGATKTKITYDANGLVTAGADASTADIADSLNKRYQTDNQQTFNDATSSIQTQLNAKIATGSAAGGDLSGTYPNPSVLNSAVLAKLLTGLNITGSTIADTDNLLEAFGKLQNQINGVLGGAIYQSVYNATTNTPTIIDGTGTKGHYYVVSVAGVQNFGSGNIDFNIGDWTIYNGTIWQKVDNTDAVASVNGFIGTVNLTSANISEVTNLYFTAARAIASELTGYVSGAGTVAATDTILQAVQKLNGNIADVVADLAEYVPLSGTGIGLPITGQLDFSDTVPLVWSGDASILSVELYLNLSDRLVVNGNPLGKGISGSQDFTPNITSLDYTQKKYVDDGLTAITNAIQNIINTSEVFYVSKQGNDTTGNGSLGSPYLTIKKAVTEANLVASNINPVSVSIDSGIYLEDTISLNSYVYIKSTDQDSAIVKPNDDTVPLFQLTDFSGISFLTIESVLNSNAVEIDNAGEYCVLHKLYIRDSYRGVLINSTLSDSYVYLEYVSIDNSIYCAIEAVSTTNFTELSCENTYTYNIDSLPAIADIISNGTNTKILFHSGSLVNQFSVGTNTGFYSTNSGGYRIRNMQIEGYQYGVNVTSGSPDIIINTCTFDYNTYNFYINSATATGYFQGYTDYSKQFINAGSTFFITNADSQIVTVAKKGGNFTSVKSAVDSILDATSTKRYIIQIGTGIFVEDTITMKPFVDMVGASFTNTVIEIDNINKNTILASPNSGLFNIQLKGSTGASVSSIEYTGGSGVFRCTNVRFGANTRFYYQTSTSGVATSIFQDCSAEGNYNFTQMFEITDNSVNASTFGLNTFTYFGIGINFLRIYGILSQTSLANVTINKLANSGNGIWCYNGAVVSYNSGTLTNFANCIYNENTGIGSIIYIGSVAARNCTNDIDILNPLTTGSIFGFFTLIKCNIDDAANISLLFTDITGEGTASLGKLWLGSKFNNLFDAKDLITSGSMGLHEGGILSINSGLDIDILEGHGYLEDNSTTPETYKRIEWIGSTLTIAANVDIYVYFNTNGILTTNTTRPNTLSNIILGRVYTNATDIVFIDLNPNNSDHLGNRLSEFNRGVFGAIYASGSLTTSNSSRQLAVTAGNYWLAENNFIPSGKAFAANFTPIYKNSTPGNWLFGTDIAVVLNDKYDNGSGTLVNTTAGYYVKHNLFLIKGSSEKHFLLIGQEEHATLIAATNAANPTKPEFFKDSVVLIASIITQEGAATFTQIADERPVPLFRGSGSLGVTSHSALSDLSANDHPQYLLKVGDIMSGNLDMGSNNITNVGTVDSVDISAHSSRHLPNGADPLTTGAASSISRLTNNTEGIANSFARQDHTHNVIEEVATIIPTALSTTTLTTGSSNRIIFTGSVFGKIVNLGDATTYTLGKIINLWNVSTQTISIVNNAATEIFRLEPFCKVEVILQDNTISNGVWIFSLTYPDYDKLVLVLDDFIASTTTGQANWNVSSSGTGAGVTQIATLFGRQGVNSLSTGTTNTGRTCLNKGGNIILFDNGLVVTEMSVRFEDLSTGTDRYTFYAGFGDNIAAGDHLDGLYFEYAEGTSGNFWRIKSSNNGTRTTTVTTSAILADTWYKLKIEIAPSGTRADFFVNGANIGNITTNIPTGTGRNTGHLLKIEKSIGGTARLVYADYINFKTFIQR
jgi:hypothetical protein